MISDLSLSVLPGDHGQALLIHSLISCLHDKPMVIMDKSDHGKSDHGQAHIQGTDLKSVP